MTEKMTKIEDDYEYTESRDGEGTAHMLQTLADAIEAGECRFIEVEISTKEFLEGDKAKRTYHLEQFETE